MSMDISGILFMLDTQKGKADNQNPTQITFLKTLSDAAVELGHYRQLGTVEELREIVAEYRRWKDNNK